MTKTLERAKKNKGKLLEGKTFYLTQKVDVDKKLMKNVVAAHGGTVRVFYGFLPAPTYVNRTVDITNSHISHGHFKARPLRHFMRG